MRSVSQFQVFPLYRQMEIRDASNDAADVDCPQWERGDEPILTSAQCILVATRSELEGPIDVEVWVGIDMEDQPHGYLLFDGELLTTGQGALIGNSLAGDMYRIALPIGWLPIRIYADRRTNPSRFTIRFSADPGPKGPS
jgi:hypothetical protein